MKKIVIIIIIILILFSMAGCDSGGGKSKTPSPGSNPGSGGMPTPIGGKTQVYGCVCWADSLGYTIPDPSGVIITLYNGSDPPVSVSTDSLGNYQLYNLNPGYYTVSIDFSQSSIANINPPPKCFVGWVINSFGSFYGFTPQNPKKCGNISGSITKVPIGTNYNDPTNREHLWFWISSARN